MKFLTLILLLLPFMGFSQVLPDGCFKQANVPAEYIEETETIHIEAVVYNVPKIEYKEQKVLVKEKAYEHYFECSVTGELKQCTRTIEPIYETVKVPIIVGYEQTVVVPASTITKVKKVKVKDGYIATVPCDKIIKNN
jgi:hypothetical protein